MLAFFSTIHVVLCVFMIFVILLQPGKDAGMGAALGGGAATTAFGGRGAVTFLGKVTAVCAVAFFLTSLGLSFVGLRTSVAASMAAKPAPTAPAEAGKSAEAPKDAPATEASGEKAAAVEPGNAAASHEASPAPVEAKPSASDAVPAEKLPAH